MATCPTGLTDVQHQRRRAIAELRAATRRLRAATASVAPVRPLAHLSDDPDWVAAGRPLRRFTCTAPQCFRSDSQYALPVPPAGAHMRCGACQSVMVARGPIGSAEE